MHAGASTQLDTPLTESCKQYCPAGHWRLEVQAPAASAQPPWPSGTKLLSASQPVQIAKGSPSQRRPWAPQSSSRQVRSTRSQTSPAVHSRSPSQLPSVRQAQPALPSTQSWQIPASQVSAEPQVWSPRQGQARVPSTHSPHTRSSLQDRPALQVPSSLQGQRASPATHVEIAHTPLRHVVPSVQSPASVHGQPSVPVVHSTHASAAQVLPKRQLSLAKQPQPTSPTVQQLPSPHSEPAP